MALRPKAAAMRSASSIHIGALPRVRVHILSVGRSAILARSAAVILLSDNRARSTCVACGRFVLVCLRVIVLTPSFV